MFLPNSNELPVSKYFLLKFLDKLTPFKYKEVKKHRICEKCGNYLGLWVQQARVKICKACQSKEVNGIIIEYDLKSLLKQAFEERNLKNLIDDYKNSQTDNANFISDMSSSVQYKKLKQNTLINNYDLLLLWNADGVPMPNSSNGQIWPVQVQITNIAPSQRRNFQYVSSMYCNTYVKKRNRT